jgi:SagB-type dehydrogenase family enzyme
MTADSELAPVSAAQWSAFTRFAVPFQREQSEMVLLTDASKQELLLTDRNALLDLLTSGFRGDTQRSANAATLDHELQRRGLRGAGVLAGDDLAHAAHWWEREWAASLDYYQWSRRSLYRDTIDEDGGQRRETLSAYLRDDGPPPARLYPAGTAVPLTPARALPSDVTLGQELLKRRTVRVYAREAVPAASLSDILWHGLAGVRLTRTTVSDDDLLHLLDSYGIAFDFYVVIYDVAEIAPGVYYYDIEAHALVLLVAGEFREEMTTNLFGQTAPRSAAWTVLIAADFLQYAWRYRHERALRNLYVDAGRVAQQLLLIAGAYAIGSFMTPALRDRALAALLHLDPARQAPLYSVTMGLG